MTSTAAEPIIIITIARQLGAGGALLGQRLAQRLGFAYLDREILQLAAQRAGASEESLAQWDERVSGFWDRIVEFIRRRTVRGNVHPGLARPRSAG